LEFRRCLFRPRAAAPVYGRTDTEGLDYARDLGDPGQYPYTRGIHETMYRGRLWTMRQFAGYGSAAQTNAGFKYLLEHGGSGVSVAFDLPTLMGRDPDHPLSLGEVGKCGVAVTSLQDMETLFDGIPLDDVDAARLLHPRGRGAGSAARQARGDDPGRHPEGVHRAEGVHLPAPAEHAGHRGHDPLLHGPHADVEHH